MAREYRKFYLQNAAGARLDLNGAQGIWATAPTGLGIQLAPAFGSLQQGFFRLLDDSAEPFAVRSATVDP